MNLKDIAEQFLANAPKYEIQLSSDDAFLRQVGGQVKPLLSDPEQIRFYDDLEMTAQVGAIMEFWTPQIAADFAMGRSALPGGARLVQQAAARARKGAPHGLRVEGQQQQVMAKKAKPKTADEVARMFLGDFDPSTPFVRHLTHKQMSWLNNTLGPQQYNGTIYFNWTVRGVNVSCAYIQRHPNNRYNSWTGYLEVRPDEMPAPSPLTTVPVVIPSEEPVTWESLAKARYGTLDLSRGEKGAITREFNRRMGIAPKKRANYQSPEWQARAARLYPGMSTTEMKPWQKANVTKNLKKWPD